MEVMRKFSEQYARRSGTYFCMDKGVTSVVIKVCIQFFQLRNLFLLMHINCLSFRCFFIVHDMGHFPVLINKLAS